MDDQNTLAGFTPEMVDLFRMAGVPTNIIGRQFVFLWTGEFSLPPLRSAGGTITGFFVPDTDTLVLVTSISETSTNPRFLRFSRHVRQWAFTCIGATIGSMGSAREEREFSGNNFGTLLALARS